MVRQMSMKRKTLYFNYATLILNKHLNKIKHAIHVQRRMRLKLYVSTAITSHARTAHRRKGRSRDNLYLKTGARNCSEVLFARFVRGNSKWTNSIREKFQLFLEMKMLLISSIKISSRNNVH